MDDSTIAFFAITFSAVIYSAISLHINKTVGNRKRVKEIQDEMNRISGMLRKTDYGTEASRKQAEAEQEKIPKLMTESMVLQFKPLLIILPIFAILTYFVRTTFPNFIIKLSFAIPTFPYYWLLLRFNLDTFPNWRDQFGTFGWLLISVLVSGLLTQVVVDQIEKRRRRK
ncbi:DUF106 domain-containing protein [Candidatus Micrarchaeota archaeon]|nr:DUF106 domain-containing protein [Candidatus Micrarchaeota archaeon]